MTNYLGNSNIFANFGAWIGGSCKPSDKGKLTALPHFQFCQHNFKNVSNMLKYEELPEVNSERWLSLEDFEGEEWRIINDCENRYSVSNYGRVKRNNCEIWYSDKPHLYKSYICKVTPLKGGYLVVAISVTKNKSKKILVHRAVASSFLPNVQNLPFINHKDENPTNNCVYNLEWCTALYNSNYGNCRQNIKMSKVYNEIANRVGLYDYNGNLLETFNTEHEAEKMLSIPRLSIRRCLKGLTTTACGLHIRYIDKPFEKRNLDRDTYFLEYNNEYKPLWQFTEEELTRILKEIDFCNSIYRRGVKCKGIKDYEIVHYKGLATFIRFHKGKYCTVYEYLN